MPRRYRYRRYTRPKKSVRYSNETMYTDWVATVKNGTRFNTHLKFTYPVIPVSNVQGMRKIKNITFNLLMHPDPYLGTEITNDNFNPNFYWALVYVPEGQGVGSSVPTDQTNAFASAYEPNQNVIMSGVGQFNSPLTRKTRLARNLNSGDTVHLIIITSIGDADTTAQQDTGFWLTGTINYAICYN